MGYVNQDLILSSTVTVPTSATDVTGTLFVADLEQVGVSVYNPGPAVLQGVVSTRLSGGSKVAQRAGVTSPWVNRDAYQGLADIQPGETREAEFDVSAVDDVRIILSADVLQADVGIVVKRMVFLDSRQYVI